MIDAGPSLRAAEGLSGSAVAAYLLTKGWRGRPSRVEGVSIFSRSIPTSDKTVEFILPVVPGFDDEQRRIADALRTMEAIERRPLATIADDVRKMSTDAKTELKRTHLSQGFAEDEPPRE